MKSVLLIGLGNLGVQICKELNALGHEVMAVDRNEMAVNAVLPYVTNAQIGSGANEAFLRSLGVENYDVCIVTIGKNFQDALECTFLLKELGAKLVVSRAERGVEKRFLLRNGADEVIDPDEQIAKWTAVRYTSDRILNFFALDDDHAIYEVSMPEEWAGKTVASLGVRPKYGINILAVKTEEGMNTRVQPEMILPEHCTLLVLGERKNLQKCFRT